MRADQELATGAQLVMPYELYAAALCLDGPTLANLELLEGSGGEAEGSLLAALDSCASPGTVHGALLVRAAVQTVLWFTSLTLNMTTSSVSKHLYRHLVCSKGGW